MLWRRTTTSCSMYIVHTRTESKRIEKFKKIPLNFPFSHWILSLKRHIVILIVKMIGFSQICSHLVHKDLQLLFTSSSPTIFRTLSNFSLSFVMHVLLIWCAILFTRLMKKRSYKTKNKYSIVNFVGLKSSSQSFNCMEEWSSQQNSIVPFCLLCWFFFFCCIPAFICSLEGRNNSGQLNFIDKRKNQQTSWQISKAVKSVYRNNWDETCWKCYQDDPMI